MKLDNFLNQVCSRVKMKQAHKKIRAELTDHIADQKNYFDKKGFDEFTSLDKSILEMGNPIEIGESLNKVYKSRINFHLIILPLILTCLGLFSAYTMLGIGKASMLPHLILPVLFLILGIKLDYMAILSHGKNLYFVVLLLDIINLYTVGTISLGAFILPMLFIGIFNQVKLDKLHGFVIGLFYMIGPGLLYIKSDISLFIIYLLASTFVYYWSFKNNRSFTRFFWTLASIFLLVGVFSITSSPKLMSRLGSFLNPSIDLTENGYLYNLFKMVLMESSLYEGVNYEIPSIGQEFTLIYMVGKHGKIFALLTICLVVALLAIMVSNRKKVINKMGKMVNKTVLLIFGFEYLVYCINNLGYIVGSVNMPFITFDLAFNMINMFLMGVLISTYNLDIVYKKD